MADWMASRGYMCAGQPIETERDVVRALCGLSHVQKTCEHRFAIEWRLTAVGEGERRSFLKAQANEQRYSSGFAEAVRREWREVAQIGLPASIVEGGIQVLGEGEVRLAELLAGPGNELPNQWMAEAEREVESYRIRVQIRDSDTDVDGQWTRVLLEFIHVGSQ